MDNNIPNYDKIKSIKNISVPKLDYEEDNKDNINEENINSIKKCEKYIIAIYEVYNNIFNSLIEFENDMYQLLNELNTNEIDDILIEKFNKNIDYFINNCKSHLSNPIIVNNIEYIYPIKKVDKEKKIYNQSIDLFYVLDGPQYFNKHLGEVSNISINSINNQNIIERGEYEFIFNKILENNKIDKNYFFKFIEDYINNIKKLRGWIYNDLLFTNSLFKSLTNIINDIDVRTNYIDDKHNNLWKNFKKNVEESIKNYLNNLDKFKK